VIVKIGNTEGKSIGAFDAKSGKLVWSSGTGAVTIQSPSLVEFLGQSYLISLHGNGISGLDPETGKVLWNHLIRLAKASDKAYEEVALIKILDAEERDSYTMPSYANGHFYVRNLSKIAAVKVSKENSAR